ncbi:Galactose oxidase/kelch repeat superfamily protein [Actinidia rufa]|uniref:Galactose oxidase/kelch repeat superfamily protein n=1 Tax=Actinidia rufa TaxID=165716 RepID=A0A7J0FZE5_9ERIC|nr:Galactose oxidase/kelch repeat superfamily protein [Actinidia rufa]
MPPGPRAGFSICVHKKRVVLFGGVVDMEVQGDVIMSFFLNELYGFQLDSRRWYPLELRKEKSTKNQTSEEKPNTAALDNKISSVEVEKVATNAKDEDLEYNEEVDVESSIDDISLDIERNMTLDDCGVARHLMERLLNLAQNILCKVLFHWRVVILDGNYYFVSYFHSIINSYVLSLSDSEASGRINSCMVVRRDTLYTYGGMMEVKDREITLDDLYTLNLIKLDEWKCIIPASESEWIETSECEDEDEYEDESGSGDDSDETDDDDYDDDVGDMGCFEVAIHHFGASRTRILVTFPRWNEVFTLMYPTFSDIDAVATQELCKDGFDLAVAQYKELKPILDELAILEAEQKGRKVAV